jgi:hypothetical protein
MSAPSATAVQAIARFDDRPFFEKALQHGIRQGILPAEKLAALCEEAPKGMVQIARYFGTEYLRPDLERARDRLVNLVSLYLEESTGGDLDQAAHALREHSLLSRSKGGSDMLKAVIALPQSSHFGMHERTGFQDKHIPLLAKWSLWSLPEYQAEKATRVQIALVVEAAVWLANQLELAHISELEEVGKDAEAVIRTALLAYASRQSAMPDWIAFEKMVLSLRRKHTRDAAAPLEMAIRIPEDLPAHLEAVVQPIRASVVADLPRILDAKLGPRKLFDQTPAFLGRYFWREDGLAELDHFEQKNGAVWDKATGGHSDDSSLLTLFVRIATHGSHLTLLTGKAAVSLVRKIQKSGLDAELPRQFIQRHAPLQLQQDYLQLWNAFMEDAAPVLRSDKVHATQDGMALLHRECNISG